MHSQPLHLYQGRHSHSNSKGLRARDIAELEYSEDIYCNNNNNNIAIRKINHEDFRVTKIHQNDFWFSRFNTKCLGVKKVHQYHH